MKTIKVKYWSEVPENYSGKVECESGDILYILNGKLHRLDGPAFTNLNGDKANIINGIFICNSNNKDHEQMFYDSKEYKIAKQQEGLLNNFKLIKNIKEIV